MAFNISYNYFGNKCNIESINVVYKVRIEIETVVMPLYEGHLTPNFLVNWFQKVTPTHVRIQD